MICVSASLIIWGVICLQQALVAQKMKAGVSTAPWGVVSRPVRAAVPLGSVHSTSQLKFGYFGGGSDDSYPGPELSEGVSSSAAGLATSSTDLRTGSAGPSSPANATATHSPGSAAPDTNTGFNGERPFTRSSMADRTMRAGATRGAIFSTAQANPQGPSASSPLPPAEGVDAMICAVPWVTYTTEDPSGGAAAPTLHGHSRRRSVPAGRRLLTCLRTPWCKASVAALDSVMCCGITLGDRTVGSRLSDTARVGAGLWIMAQDTNATPAPAIIATATAFHHRRWGRGKGSPRADQSNPSH
mmetsp:Transcript_142882/g.249224  ORF Transcript_142882/g.249224 Transcript_142882/m.249224 type:complete len:300 (-) Transcript_142882:84-983(-)